MSVESEIRKSFSDVVDHVLSPNGVAALFCDWSSERQAMFFNEVCRLAYAWDQSATMQWRWMEKDLTTGAAQMLLDMAEHTDGARA